MKVRMGAIFARIFRAVVFFLFYAFGRIGFGARRTKDSEPIEGNAVLLLSHASMFDFAHLASAIFPKRVRFVVRSFEFNRNALYSWVLRTLGFIPKKQGTTDVACVREIVRACRAGEIVALYPAGMTSFDGRPGWKPQSGTGTLVKMLSANVYVGMTVGSFLSYPRYVNKLRRGRVDVTVKRLFTAEEARAMSTDALQQAIERALSFNEWDWMEKEKPHFSGAKSVRGLRRLFYRCPVCGEEGSMQENGKKLKCASCGMELWRDKYGFLQSDSDACPKRMDEWVDLQNEALKKEIADDQFALTANVTLKEAVDEGKSYRVLDTGVLTLNKSGLTFAGAKENKHWTEKDFQYFILNDVDFLHIFAPDNAYRFVFEDTRMIYKWFFAHRIMMGMCG